MYRQIVTRRLPANSRSPDAFKIAGSSPGIGGILLSLWSRLLRRYALGGEVVENRSTKVEVRKTLKLIRSVPSTVPVELPSAVPLAVEERGVPTQQ